MITKKVKFYWWKSYKVWEVSGNTLDDVVFKCWALVERYNAIHFEIL